MSFTQSDWLAGYIHFNTVERRKSGSKYAKNFFKLMNNSVFGKCQENMRNRIHVEMVTSKARALKLVSKPTYKNTRRIREDLCVITSGIKTLKLCKPIVVGFSI